METTEQVKPEVQADPLKVVVTLVRDRKVESDMIVTFTVKDEARRQFSEIFENYLKSFPADTKIKVETADDTLTKRPVRAFVSIDTFGAQQLSAQRLQQFAQVLGPHCLEIQ